MHPGGAPGRCNPLQGVEKSVPNVGRGEGVGVKGGEGVFLAGLQAGREGTDVRNGGKVGI